jgi:hypothetical protein
MTIFKYRVRVKHDNGLIDIITNASNYASLIRIVMACENCPERAIKSIKVIKEINI